MALNQKKYNSEELNENERQLRLQHRFLVLRKLGQGTYGKVQLALNKETNEEVAVKTIKKAKIENEEDMLRIRREIHIMTALQHPHIIHINEVFETKQKIVIVMQYASGGELYDYLGCHQTLPEDEARRIFRQIASAIYYCHKNQICHRDLKLENILLDEEGNAKIADFGLSNIFDDKRRMNTFCGSPLYASPEIVKGTPYKGPEVDCWSLGVLLYTLVYGTMPFDGRNFKELVSQISEGRYEEPINRSNASSLIRQLLTPDISRRATITDVCKDNWVNQGYETLLEVAENMALAAGIPRRQTSATKACTENNTKNGREKSIFKKAAAQLEETAGKFTSIFTKNFENSSKTNSVNSHMRKSTLYEQMTNYDVRYVLNKLLSTVEASLNADKNTRNFITAKDNNIHNMQMKKEIVPEKVDSAYVIPIFEVTSVIPDDKKEIVNVITEKPEKVEKMNLISNGLPPKSLVLHNDVESHIHRNIKAQQISNSADIKSPQSNSETVKNSLKMSAIRNKNHLYVEGCPRNQPLLTESQRQFYSLDISGQPDTHKVDHQNRKLREPDHTRHPSPKTKRMNDNFPFSQKQPGPFMRTKHHVLTLARLLSLNYEKIMKNSFRMPTCKKKLPGKITIPPTFDPNNPPVTTKKHQEEKKDLLIFPTVSVSENKEKIEKKIEKIKKAALNKNIIIRSDSKTRMRIEKYIRSQVKKIQDLVCEEQRSIHASLEHLDEQSLRDMSEMYYRAFGSENTDSGIANAEEEDYFCFLCSKPKDAKGTINIVDALFSQNIKKGCLYTSNHLHIPRKKEPNKWGYASNSGNAEFGPLNRCKSEIEFPIEYLNYVSSNSKMSDLNKRTYEKQQIQKNSIGNTTCFLTIPSTLKPDNSNLRILRSASDSIGLHLSKNTFEVVKLNTDGHDSVLQNYDMIPHFLGQKSSSKRCEYTQLIDHYERQSSATDASFKNTSHMLEKDDGIGDSNDSFQSYIDTLEYNSENNSEMPRSKSSHDCLDFRKENSNNNKRSAMRLTSEPYLKYSYENDDSERQQSEAIANMADILDSVALDSENGFVKQNNKNKSLRRRNTMTCIRGKTGENFDQTTTEFENYLWNAYKEHLLENNQSDTEFSSSPDLNYYSFDRKAKFKGRDSKSMDFINGDHTSDSSSLNFANFLSLSEQESMEPNSSAFKTVLNHSKATKKLLDRSSGRLSRTKSIGSESVSDGNRDDIIRKLRAERKLSQESNTLDANNSMTSLFFSDFLNDLEKREQSRKADNDTNRRRYSKNNSPLNKRTQKSEYKKSFLQLLALKRIQEAEKELDKSHKSNLQDTEEESSGTLLEALKTHGYKTVISQRFQDTDDDSLDPFHMRYLKSPRNLRAELARLNYMYYESLPRYTLDPSYEETDYFYDDLDYTRSLLNGLATPYVDMQTDFRQKTPKQTIYDWLNTTQTDDYIGSVRSDSLYIPEETTPTSDKRKCCTQWGKEHYRSFDDENTSESQDTLEEYLPNGTFNGYLKNKEVGESREITNHISTENSRLCSNNIDDERQESVQDRIWRKSFYSRFNNRALSRKERSSFMEPEFLSESRLGLLNSLYNPSKTGFERSEFSPWDELNRSSRMKKSKKHSPSFDKFEYNSSIKKKYSKTENEKAGMFANEATSSNTDSIKVCNTPMKNEEQEPEH